jgi:predicted hydrocarbon binding protein
MNGAQTCAHELQQRVQGLMMFLGALSDGLESVAGIGAEATCFSSGQMVGLARDVERTETDIFATLDAVRHEMEKMNIDWPFDAEYHKQHPNRRGDSTEIDLPFKNCIVRCTLFRYGFPQGKSLCQTKHGLFCGLFEKINGTAADLEVVHPGENACLLRLKLHGQN